MDAGLMIRTARRQSRLSLRALAGRAGTSHATLSAYENGRVDPTTAVLSRIIGATGYSLETTLLGIPSDIEGMSRGDELIASGKCDPVSAIGWARWKQCQARH